MNLRRVIPLVPALLLVLGVFVLPVGALIAQSLVEPEFGLGTYSSVLGNDTNVSIILRTVRMALIVSIVCGLLAFPYAYVMTRVRGGALLIMVGILLMPFWTSLLARSFAWVVLLQRDGPVSEILALFGFDNVVLLGTATGVTIGMTQVMLPFFALPLYASLRTIDLRLIDAAKGLGASPFSAFMRIYLPLSLPGLIGGALMVFVISLGFYVTPALIGSPRESMVAQLMSLMIDRLLDFPAAGVLAAAVLLVALVGVTISRLLPRLLRVGGTP